MEIVKKRKRRKIERDPKKEARYRELVSDLRARGFSVRREELGRGLSWKVVSGTCRLFQERLVLVDRRMRQSDQISFLESVLALVGEQQAGTETVDCAPNLEQNASPDATRDMSVNSP